MWVFNDTEVGNNGRGDKGDRKREIGGVCIDGKLATCQLCMIGGSKNKNDFNWSIKEYNSCFALKIESSVF